jgi:hypothetical protein
MPNRVAAVIELDVRAAELQMHGEGLDDQYANDREATGDATKSDDGR